jgi:hypothetical protein
MTGNFRMIPGEIDPSARMGDTMRAQTQAASLRFDSSGNAMNWSKVESIACCNWNFLRQILSLEIQAREPENTTRPIFIQMKPIALISLRAGRRSIMTNLGFLAEEIKIWFDNQIFNSKLTT